MLRVSAMLLFLVMPGCTVVRRLNNARRANDSTAGIESDRFSEDNRDESHARRRRQEQKQQLRKQEKWVCFEFQCILYISLLQKIVFVH